METLELIKTHQKYSGYEKIQYIRNYPIVRYKQMKYENESDGLNKIQTLLYKRAIFGIGVYSNTELSKISLVKLKKINHYSNRAQNVLNLWKQELVISSTNRLLESIFPNSELAKDIVKSYSIPDSGFVNRMDFKIFGISKKTIITKLILEKALPNNFYELKDTIIRSRVSLHLL